MVRRKGILLVGGRGTRLHPATKAVNKHLLPVYDKPLAYYSLSVLMLAGLRDILVISAPDDLDGFRRLFDHAERIGLRLDYAPQAEPRGIAEALVIAEPYLAGAPSALVLGDNIFFGQGLVPLLRSAAEDVDGATVFASRVRDPERFGVVTLGADGRPTAIEEKPARAISNLAVTGLYFYPADASSLARRIMPSGRGELEITDLNRAYIEQGRLAVHVLGRGIAWLDAGTPASLLAAAHFIETIEQRQSLKIACIEEVAYWNGWIGKADLIALAGGAEASDYGKYLVELTRW